MPDGKTHLQIILVSLIPVIVLSLTFLTRETAIILSVSMIIGEVWLSPDLEHHIGTTAFRAWGPLRIIWKPYQKLARHRGWSHWPVIGTLGRLLYLAVIPAIVIALHPSRPQIVSFILDYQEECILAAIGVDLSSIVHIAADYS